MPKSKTVLEPSNREIAFAGLRTRYKDIHEPYKVEPVSSENVLSTPSLSLNLLCGQDRGIRMGSIVHVYGLRGSLKTWIGWEMAREAQQKWPEKVIAVIDTERRSDLYQVQKLIDVNFEPYDTGVPRVVYRRPEHAEEAWEMIGNFAASGHFSLIVLDSATALRSKSEVDNPDFSLGQVGNAARINSAALKKYAPVIESSGTILWGINQQRVLSIQPLVTKGPTGGEAWGFYATHEFKISRISHEHDTKNQKLKIESKKMKYAWGDKEVEIPIILGHGIDVEGDIVEAGVEAGIIEKSGSWYKYQGENLAQGVPKSAEILRDKPELKAEISELILAMAKD